MSERLGLRGLWAKALCAVMGIASAMSFVIGAEGYVGMSDPPASSTSYLWCALALCFALLFWHVYARRGLRPGAACALFGLLFGVVNALGGMLFARDSWAELAGASGLALAVLRCAGQALPMIALLTWLDAALRGGRCMEAGADAKGNADGTDAVAVIGTNAPAGAAGPVGTNALAGADAPARPAPASPRFPRIRRFARKHPLAACMLALALCWSPYLLVFYPGTVCWDLGEMAAQFFGKYPMDTWHPVFTTWLFGGCIWLGRLFHSDNLGAFLFTLLQTAALSLALSRVVMFLRRMGARRAVWIGALAFFALVPLWGGYAQFISKDTLYTAALLLFTLEVLALFCAREDGTSSLSQRGLAGLFGWGLLTCLLRSNGLYVVLPTAVFTVIFGARGRARLHAGAALGLCVACALLFANALVPALGIRDETASGLYSVCFQQSARVLRDHGAEVTPEEYAEIDRVLDAANLPDLYEPWIADPVKYTFRQYGQGAQAEREALGRYARTWLSMFGKYPLSYAEAFFAGNVSYYAFTPKIEGETYNQQAGNRLAFETAELGESRGDDPRFVDTTQPALFARARTLLSAFARGWRHIPLLSLLYACAFYTWLLVGAAVSTARARRWRMLCCFLPALLSLGVCMLGPVNDYFRYFLPVAAMAPALLGVAGKGRGDGRPL